MKNVKVDNMSFNAKHYQNSTEDQFIKDQINSVPDSYGSKENKIAFLKEAYAKIAPKTEKKEEKK